MCLSDFHTIKSILNRILKLFSDAPLINFHTIKSILNNNYTYIKTTYEDNEQSNFHTIKSILNKKPLYMGNLVYIISILLSLF